MRHRLGRMTAEATTGPASGPRPASSRPATRRNPRTQASASKTWSGTRGTAPWSGAGRHAFRGCNDRNGCVLGFAFRDIFPFRNPGHLAFLLPQIVELRVAHTSLAD